MFVAGAGSYAHLHFDGDHRDTLLYQVFGRKRCVVIHPNQTHKLAPCFEPDIYRTSSWFLENFTREDQHEFLRFVQARECILEPGDTLYIPMMAWHYIEYPDPAMSIGFRLGRNDLVKTLARLNPMPSVFAQALALELADEARARARFPGPVERLGQAAARYAELTADDLPNVERFLGSMCEEICPRQARKVYTLSDLKFRRALSEDDHPRAGLEREGV